MSHWKNGENQVTLLDTNRLYHPLKREHIHFLLADEGLAECKMPRKTYNG